jgi:5-formyltetrahydrofolate cyclo-ligase
MEKAEARGVIQKRIQRLTEEEIVRRSNRIEEHLFSFEQFQKARFPMFFISMRDEVVTLPMIERSLKQGKRVAAPRTILSERRMVLIEASLKGGRVPVRRGEYSIWEPLSDAAVEPERIDFVVVPGRAFDKKGNRLGRGGGYYDKFLKSLRQDICFCALAFECQVLDDVPTDETDHPVDALITETGIYEF